MRRGGKRAAAAGDLRDLQVRSSGTARKARAAVRPLLAGAVGFVAGAWMGSAFLSHAPEAAIAMYKRSGAFTKACEAAGAEISRLRRATRFVEDCSVPIVTPLLGWEGQVIVSRTVEGKAGHDEGALVTYSVKLDGSGLDRWRVLDVKRAPNRIMLDASLLLTAPSQAVQR
jgi:hypothetical protein